ncbi:TPA: exodeoxyribonuclease, partial [Raoultella ornithinolytica]|nr:exodeoxyribonuclease [Raoultella ornithinolytica]
MKIAEMELNTDENYIQNLLLAVRNIPEVENLTTANLWKMTSAVKKVFPTDKRSEFNQMLNFLKIWMDAPHIDRWILVNEWASDNRLTIVQRTDVGTNAGGMKTDRNPDLVHSLDTLDIELASALLPMDFNIYEIPGGVLRRAKEIISQKEEPWKSWSAILRKSPGVLDLSRAAIFVLVRNAPENIHTNAVTHLEYINRNLNEVSHIPDTGIEDSQERWERIKCLFTPVVPASPTHEEVSNLLAAERGEFVEGISDPADPKWITEDLTKKEQPQIASLGAGMFSIEGLMASPAPTKEEATSNVQMEAAQPVKVEVDNAVSAGESTNADDPQAAAVTTICPDLAAEVLNDQTALEPAALEGEYIPGEDGRYYFEPGRYVGVPNEIYHSANGTSSTMVKDARVSLMYFERRHVTKTIQKLRSSVLDMGNLVHALALQPGDMDKEFSVEPEIPEGAFTTTATIRSFIDEYNATLPALLSSDDIKALLDAHNATLPAPFPLGASVDESYASYEQLPEEFQRIENGTKHTASAMKACIKEYNATLPAPVKTSGSRDALLEQLAIINPDLVAQEAQKPQPLKVSGTKTDLIQVVRSVKPDAIFADELLDAWRENPEGKVLVTLQQLSTALAIQKALLNHP